MSRMSRFAFVAIAALAAAGYSNTASATVAKPVIFSQAACNAAGQAACVEFETGDPIPVIREVAFTVPSAGRAAVTFTASLTCSVSGTGTPVVRLLGQIVSSPTATPDPLKPSTLQHMASVPASGEFVTFNLGSTRVFNYASAGSKHVYFRMVDSGGFGTHSCSSQNAAFSVVFVS